MTLEEAFKAGFVAALWTNNPKRIGAEDEAWQHYWQASMTCCGLPLTADGVCRLSGEQIDKQPRTT